MRTSAVRLGPHAIRVDGVGKWRCRYQISAIRCYSHVSGFDRLGCSVASHAGEKHAQRALHLSRLERATQQPVGNELPQPLAVQHVSLAARNVSHMPRSDRQQVLPIPAQQHGRDVAHQVARAETQGRQRSTARISTSVDSFPPTSAHG